MLLLDPSAPAEQYVLFVRPRDREMEIWNGRREGVDGAKERYGADAAYPISELDEQLKRRLVGRSSVYTQLGNADARGQVQTTRNKPRPAAKRVWIWALWRVLKPSAGVTDIQ